MRKTGFLAVVAVLAVSACAETTAPANEFTATLRGESEVPAVATTATGTATFTVNGSNLNYTVSWTGLSGNATQSHIHVAAAGATGPVRLNICGAGGTPACPTGVTASVTGTATAANLSGITMDDLLAQARNFTAYVNVHTAANLGGEIRGQLIPH